MALIALSVSAGAYELKRDSNGETAIWPGSAVLVMDPEAAQALGAEDALEAAQAAADAFGQADPRISLSVQAGTTHGVGYSFLGGNQSEIVVVKHDWPYDTAAIAVTIVTVDTRQHTILDADVALNAQARRFRVLPPTSESGGDYDDLQNTLTHEFGHVLGLAHNPYDQAATMFPAARRGETHKRTLAQDDVDGLEALYPEDGVVARQAEVGCASVPGGAAPWVALAVAAWLLSRRRGAKGWAKLAAPLAGLLLLPALARAEEPKRYLMTARVERAVTRVEGGLFITRLELRASACARGPCPERLEVERLGGKIGDLEQWVDGQLPPAEGAEVGVDAGDPRPATLYRLDDIRERAAYERAVRGLPERPAGSGETRGAARQGRGIPPLRPGARFETGRVEPNRGHR